jgi:methyl-accepting chemotaxis protein
MKFKKEDIYDCTACGYGKCESMATAMFNNLNKAENCAHRNLILLEKEKQVTVFICKQLGKHIDRALDLIEKINNLVENLNSKIYQQSATVNDSSAATEEMLESIKVTSELSRKKRENIKDLIDNAAKGQEAMKETVQAVQNISESVDGIGSAIKIISVIAANTNLLSMNAAIEAAHAGDAGKGFAVVAGEIRRLSESTRENSRNISQTLSEIIGGINTSSKRSNEAGNLINNMAEEINNFASVMSGLIDTLTELSAKSSGITGSLNDLKNNSELVKTDYSDMLQLADKLRYDINFLAAMSTDIVKAIESNDYDLISQMTQEHIET